MTVHQSPPAPRPAGLLRRLAAFWWWSLRVHVAERHFLPRPERPDL